jgi:hypothetical protein
MNPCVVTALDAATASKEQIVDFEGIGADLRPTVYAFGESDSLIGGASLTAMRKVAGQSNHPSANMFGKLRFAVSVMRQVWAAKEAVVILEGYSSIGEVGGGLAKRFADGDKEINECLMVYRFSSLSELSVTILPYRIGLGRKVEWLYELLADNGTPWPADWIEPMVLAMRQNVAVDKLNMRDAMIAASLINLGNAGFSAWSALEIPEF